MVTDADVETTAKTVMGSLRDADGARTTYLRKLTEAVQEALGKKGQDVKAQLAALQTVHERFYAVIARVADEIVPKGTKDRGISINKLTTFARTTVSALRMHVRAGGDLVALKATQVTKAALRARSGPPRVSPKRLKASAERQGKQLMATLMGLADADRAGAIEEMQLILGQVANQLVQMGVKSTSDADESIAEHRPLKIGKQLFMPTASQVIQQRARPS